VFNKSDMLTADDRASLERRYPNAVFVSGLTGEGLAGFISRIGDEAARGSETLTVVLPYTRGDLVALAHERAQILSERHLDEGTQLVVRVSKELVGNYEPYRVVDGE